MNEHYAPRKYQTLVKRAPADARSCVRRTWAGDASLLINIILETLSETSIPGEDS